MQSACSVASFLRQSLLQSLCGVSLQKLQKKKNKRVRPACQVNARGTLASHPLALTTRCHACRAVQHRNAHARRPPPTPSVRRHGPPWTPQARGKHTRGACPSSLRQRPGPLMASSETVVHHLCRYRLARCHRHPLPHAEMIRRLRRRRPPKVSAACASRPCGRPVAANMQPCLFRRVPATACT